MKKQPRYGDLNRVIGEEVPSFETVCRWIRSFADSRLSFEDEARCGRPRISVTEDNIESTRQLLEANAHVTEEELSTELGISVGSIHTILKKRYWSQKFVPVGSLIHCQMNRNFAGSSFLRIC